MVVSLPGLDISPGDLFVSNGAADLLNGSLSGKNLQSKTKSSVKQFPSDSIRNILHYSYYSVLLMNYFILVYYRC